MRTRVALLIGLLASATLAGCAADPEDEANGNGPDEPNDGGVPFARPAAWTEGQWWRYATTNADGPADPVELAVSEVGADTYTLDTSGRQMAAFEAEFDISYVGAIAKADLSGRQGNDVVEYFRFPLTQGKDWTTRWDGVERTVRVESVGQSRVELVGLEGDLVRVRYSYDNTSGFFGHMVFLTDEGQTQFGMDLADHGRNFTGVLVRAETEELLSASGGGGPAVADFAVPEGADELVVRITVNCTEGTGHWDLVMTPTRTQAPQDEIIHASGDCPATVAEERVVQTPTPGPWSYTAFYGSPPQGALAHEVSVTARSYAEFTLS